MWENHNLLLYGGLMQGGVNGEWRSHESYYPVSGDCVCADNWGTGITYSIINSLNLK